MPKLAEALAERKALQERFTRLCNRLRLSAKAQEGEQPAEQPDTLINEAGRVLEQIKELTININRTNIGAVLPDSGADNDGGKMSIMQAIAERDRLKGELSMLETLGQAARVEPAHGYGVTRNEVKWRSTVNIADLQTSIDALSQHYRMLDTRIQEANWQIDLIEG